MTATPTRRRRREALLPYLLLLPGLLLLVGILYPFCLGFYYSLTGYYLQYPHLFRFIWLGNYIKLVQEPLFAYSLQVTLLYTLAAVPPQLILSLFVQKFIVRGLTMGAIILAV